MLKNQLHNSHVKLGIAFDILCTLNSLLNFGVALKNQLHNSHVKLGIAFEILCTLNSLSNFGIALKSQLYNSHAKLGIIFEISSTSIKIQISDNTFSFTKRQNSRLPR